MALVVESTSTASVNSSASVTVTKPTGVVSGDLLLILSYDGATCSGFSTAYSGVGVTMLYKIADSGDVSASNYSVAHGGSTNSGIAVMMRVSGWVSGNPVYASDYVSGSQDSTSPLVLSSSGLSIQRPSDNCLMIFLNQIGSDALGAATWASYGVTSGESNPSWTEVFDGVCEVGSGSADNSVSVAYATTTNNTPITARTVTASSDTTGGTDFFRSHLLILNAPNSETGTLPLGSVEVTDFNPAISTNTAPTLALGNVSITDYAPTADAREVTQWTNSDKPSSTWTNSEK